jgi:hypothetical protein
LTHERAAALAAARRHGLDAAEALARFQLVETSLDSVDTPGVISAERENEILAKFLAGHRPASPEPPEF